MNEITQIDVLPCRDVEPLLVVTYHKTPKTMQPESVVKDAIGQDVIIGDVLWRDGLFYAVTHHPVWGLVAGGGVHAFTVSNSGAIRCPRPGELMPCFDAWSEMLYAMQEDGAKIECRHLFNPTPENINYLRSPDCTWRKPHPGAELKDAQVERVVNGLSEEQKAAANKELRDAWDKRYANGSNPFPVNLLYDLTTHAKEIAAQAECVGY